MLVRLTPNWPGPKDIALGRGGMANKHAGNRAFRKKVELWKKRYLKADPVTKKTIICQLKTELQEEGFRFVEFNKVTNCWVIINTKKSQRKIAQALREKESRAGLINNTGTTAVAVDANWVQHESTGVIQDERCLSFDTEPLPVDYQTLGHYGTAPDKAEMDEEYVPLLLEAFGMLKV